MKATEIWIKLVNQHKLNQISEEIALKYIMFQSQKQAGLEHNLINCKQSYRLSLLLLVEWSH